MPENTNFAGAIWSNLVSALKQGFAEFARKGGKMDAAARLKHVKRLKPALAHRDRSIMIDLYLQKCLILLIQKNPSFCEDVGCFFVQCGKQTKDGHELVSMI